jgi:transposase
MTKRVGQNSGIRYSEAFKMRVVREVEEGDLPFNVVRRKYGIGGRTMVSKWVIKYGNGSRGKRIRVETPEEIDEFKRLRQRVRQLESLLADSNVELALERQYTRLACKRAGIKDLAEFKKKFDGILSTEQ